ncbi:hypothetical protein IAU60_005605 [Kwoniella sp. DSM 27419]
MLLRLLPLPTPVNPSPLTILFTLPLPTHPYTARSLPLPPALLAHRALCLQEDIDCPNVLLGEKSSWISGIIDDVTFSLPSSTITVNCIDGTSTTLPVTEACITQLHRVIDEVQLSFSAPSQVSASPRSSISSIASTSSASSSGPSTPTTQRRTPSSLLLSLLSPLLPNNQTTGSSRHSLSAPPCAPARAHRRAARSILVDTYRRYVLPSLKEQLPCSFFSWIIASETARQMEEFGKVQTEVNHIINNCGVSRASLDRGSTMTRSHSISSTSSSSMSEEDSDVDSILLPITPSTSVFSSSACTTPARKLVSPSPHAFILSIPPAHALPVQYQAAYASLLARLTAIASRVNQIKKLLIRYEREEGKRRWLEGLERGRLADRAIRRAYCDGVRPAGAAPFVTSEVNHRSRLWQSWSADDQARSEITAARIAASHPCMLDVSSDDGEREGEVDYVMEISDSDEEGPITPPKSRNSPERPTISIVGTSDPVVEGHNIGLQIRRPALERQLTHKLVRISTVGVNDMDHNDSQSPDLEGYHHDDTDDEWEHEENIATPTLLSPPVIPKSWTVEAVPTLQKQLIVDPVADSDSDEEPVYYGQCRIYA